MPAIFETDASGTHAPNTRAEPVVVAAEVVVPCEVYSRIVGYLTPVRNWNTGKRQEFGERRNFNVEGL